MSTGLAKADGAFDFDSAFGRNLGLISPGEQARLRDSTVAIAGAGGVGGGHALALARQGVGGFHLADGDTFSLANINRQAAAFMSTLGRNKAATVRDMILDINPEARVTVLEDYLGAGNLDAFLEGVDLVVDGVDFFALDARQLLFERAAARGLWCLTAGPLGFGSAFLAFDPKGMSFGEYFDLREGMTMEERLSAFLVGLAPEATQRSYLDMSYVNLQERRGPSAGLACQLCNSIVALEAMAILLQRRPPDAAPSYTQLDLYKRVYRRGRLRRGNRGPLQRLKRALVEWNARRLGLTDKPALPGPGET